jgi:hypothetical protein
MAYSRFSPSTPCCENCRYDARVTGFAFAIENSGMPEAGFHLMRFRFDPQINLTRVQTSPGVIPNEDFDDPRCEFDPTPESTCPDTLENLDLISCNSRFSIARSNTLRIFEGFDEVLEYQGFSAGRHLFESDPDRGFTTTAVPLHRPQKISVFLTPFVIDSTFFSDTPDGDAARAQVAAQGGAYANRYIDEVIIEYEIQDEIPCTEFSILYPFGLSCREWVVEDIGFIRLIRDGKFLYYDTDRRFKDASSGITTCPCVSQVGSLESGFPFFNDGPQETQLTLESHVCPWILDSTIPAVDRRSNALTTTGAQNGGNCNTGDDLAYYLDACGGSGFTDSPGCITLANESALGLFFFDVCPRPCVKKSACDQLNGGVEFNWAFGGFPEAASVHEDARYVTAMTAQLFSERPRIPPSFGNPCTGNSTGGPPFVACSLRHGNFRTIQTDCVRRPGTTGGPLLLALFRSWDIDGKPTPNTLNIPDPLASSGGFTTAGFDAGNFWAHTFSPFFAIQDFQTFGDQNSSVSFSICGCFGRDVPTDDPRCAEEGQGALFADPSVQGPLYMPDTFHAATNACCNESDGAGFLADPDGNIGTEVIFNKISYCTPPQCNYRTARFSGPSGNSTFDGAHVGLGFRIVSGFGEVFGDGSLAPPIVSECIGASGPPDVASEPCFEPCFKTTVIRGGVPVITSVDFNCGGRKWKRLITGEDIRNTGSIPGYNNRGGAATGFRPLLVPPREQGFAGQPGVTPNADGGLFTPRVDDFGNGHGCLGAHDLATGISRGNCTTPSFGVSTNVGPSSPTTPSRCFVGAGLVQRLEDLDYVTIGRFTGGFTPEICLSAGQVVCQDVGI